MLLSKDVEKNYVDNRERLSSNSSEMLDENQQDDSFSPMRNFR